MLRRRVGRSFQLDNDLPDLLVATRNRAPKLSGMSFFGAAYMDAKVK